MKSTKENKEKEPNDIRISIDSRARYVIKYAQLILQEKKCRELKFSAVGGSIGTLLNIVEVMKITTPGLYQQNKISSVAYQTVDSNNQVTNQRLYPKLEVILSLDQIQNKTEGYQDMLDESTRKELEKAMEERNKKRDERRNFRGRGFRARRGNRGRGFRARRGFRGRGFRSNNRRGRGFRRATRATRNIRPNGRARRP